MTSKMEEEEEGEEEEEEEEEGKKKRRRRKARRSWRVGGRASVAAPNTRRVASRAALSRMRPWAAEERKAVSRDQRQGEEEEEEGEDAVVAETDDSFSTSMAASDATEEGGEDEGRVDGGNAKRAGKAAGLASLVDTKIEANDDRICVVPSPTFNALEITGPPSVPPSASTPTGAPPIVVGETKTRLSKEGTTA